MLGAGTHLGFLPSGPRLSWPEYLALPWPAAADPALVCLQAAQRHLELFAPLTAGFREGDARNTQTIGAAMLAAIARMKEPWTPGAPLQARAEDALVADFLIDAAARIRPPLEEGSLALTQAYLFGSLTAQLATQQPLATRQLIVTKLLGWPNAGPSGSLAADPGTWALDPEPALRVAAVILAHSQGNVYFSGPESVKGLGDTKLESQVGEAFLSWTSVDAWKLAPRIAEELRDRDGLDTGTLKFWLFNPIVHLGSGHYVLAPNGWLMDSLMLGTVHRLMADERARRGGAKTPLSDALGHRFESYIGEILARAGHGSAVWPEQPISTKRGAKHVSTDFTIWDAADPDAIVLLETKLRGMPAAVFGGSEPGALRAALESVLVPPLFQALRTVYHMHESRSRNDVPADAEPLVDAVLRARQVTVAVVLPDYPTSLNCKLVHRLSEEIVGASILSPEARESWPGFATWFTAYRASHYIRWVWLRAADLELYAGWKYAPPLAGTLNRFAALAMARPLLLDRSVALTWNDWLLSLGASGELHPELRAQAGDFWNSQARAVYGRDLTNPPAPLPSAGPAA
jgi:hypothetical protein